MLTVVPTPIGNMGDITLRALETLRCCDLVAAEDTRHTGLLLKHHQIQKPFVSLHEHNEAARSAQIMPRLLEGLHVALVSDAGTPAISDPGSRLIRQCLDAGVAVTVLPGACAATTALVGSGLAASSFFFGGFLPNKSGRREKTLREALARDCPSVYYESPHRLLKTLSCLEALDPARPLCVARELTKHFEEFRRGTPLELLAHYQTHPPKGEICLVLGPPPPSNQAAKDPALAGKPARAEDGLMQSSLSHADRRNSIPRNESRRAFTLVEILVGMAVIATLAAILWPTVTVGLAKSESTRCLGNLRALGVALNLYLAENQGIMPELAAARSSRTEEEPVIDTVLDSYVDDPRVFRCPADHGLAQATGTSYFYNSTLGGQPVATMNFLGLIEGASRIPVLVDKEGWHRNNSPRVNHLFADGHATSELRLFAQ